MAYNKAFNTPLVVFAAFNGDMVSDFPVLKWTRKSAASLGLPSATTFSTVLSSGTSFLASGYANSTYNYAYHDPVTNTWIASFNSTAKKIYNGNGVYLFVNGTSVYVSFDGQTLQYAGYLPSLINSVMCGASDGKYGLLSAWHVNNPMYAKSDIGTSGAWVKTGTYDADGICCFEIMTCHQGKYIGVASETTRNSGKEGIQISTDGYRWVRTIKRPYGHSSAMTMNFGSLRSVGNRLFMTCGGYSTATPRKYVYQLCVLNSNARSYSIVRQEETDTIPSLLTMVYVEKLGMYLHFGDNVIYASPDGFKWEAIPQTNFGGKKNTAIYVPGDGFYVTDNGSYGSNTIYYSAYP